MNDWAITIVMLAMLGQVLLAFRLYLRLYKLRVAHAKSKQGKLDLKQAALGKATWPNQVLQYESAVRNQFEAPVLFFSVCILAIATNLTSFPFAILAMVFVGLRIWHARIHVGNNKLVPRIKVFSSSLITVVAMWVLVVGHHIFRQFFI